MKHLNEYRDSERVKMLVDAIAKATTQAWNIMEVCGGQTHSIAQYRLEEMLPSNITLLHGPGCPVCVTPMEIIDAALEIAKREDVIFTSFGDMMRVPGTSQDLLKVKALGADARMLYSPLDAVSLAEKNPDKEVVFFAIGFETTVPTYLMALQEAERLKLTNFSLLTSLFTVPPAINAILSDDDNRVDGFLAAGHVCSITGYESYHVLAERYKTPLVVTGFEPVDLLYGIYRCILQLETKEAKVENAYTRAVAEEGNKAIIKLMDTYLEPFDLEWRGIGRIPQSGLKLKSQFAEYDASKKFAKEIAEQANVAERDKLANLCIAGNIMKGKKQVSDCPHFGTNCTPENPIGAPMVSSEGVCAAYYNYK